MKLATKSTQSQGFCNCDFCFKKFQQNNMDKLSIGAKKLNQLKKEMMENKCKKRRGRKKLTEKNKNVRYTGEVKDRKRECKKN